VGNLGAKEIGNAYHSGNISKPLQLTLHGILGCGMGAAANGSGGCASGAVSGITGELTAEVIGDNTSIQGRKLAELSGLAGGLSAIITGNALGLDDGEIADNIFSGQRIAANAAENNYLMPQEKAELVRALDSCNGNTSCQQQVQIKYAMLSKPRDEEFIKLYDGCKAGNQQSCSAFKAIHYDLRMELTQEGNKYYNSLTEAQRTKEFMLLPPNDSIFHTWQRDQQTGNVINVLTGRESGITKYVHPIYGYEVVLDAKKNIITDPLNIGTYNFYNPNLGMGNEFLEGFINHKDFDIDPYYLYGNTLPPSDPTSFEQRIIRSTNRYLNFNFGK
jgi:filamentous hemagglutinin